MKMLQDANGKTSSNRTMAWFVVGSSMFCWLISCVVNGYAEPGWSFAALVGAAMGAQAVKGLGEVAGQHFGKGGR